MDTGAQPGCCGEPGGCVGSRGVEPEGCVGSRGVLSSPLQARAGARTSPSEEQLQNLGRK